MSQLSINHNFDGFLNLLGNPGRFQMLQFVLLSLLFVPLAMNDLIPIFYDLEPTHVECITSDNDITRSTSAAPYQYTTTSNSTESHSADKWWHTHEACPCSNGEYRYTYGQPGQWSIIADMNLICDRRSLISLASTIYFIGCALGGPIFGWMADKYGRRPSLFLTNILYTIFNVGLVFTTNYVAFVILRFGAGFARQGMQSTFLVLMLEWTHPDQRSRIGAATQFFYVIGVLLLALVGFLLLNWHHIQIVLACANIVAVSYIWMAPEALQWSLMQDRVQEAQENALKVTKFNGIHLKEKDLDILVRLQETEKANTVEYEKRYTLLDCFRTPKIRVLTLLTCYIWFVANFGYIGISYMISSISENVYSNLAIAGALEAIPTALTLTLVSKFGRRYPMAGYFLLATILLILSGTLPESTGAQLPLSLLGRMSIVGCFSIIYVWAAEIFPTPIRNNGFGIVSLAFMVGGMVAPEALRLGELFGMESLAIPITVIGCATGFGILAALILPETKNKRLPATVEDVDELPYGCSGPRRCC